MSLIKNLVWIIVGLHFLAKLIGEVSWLITAFHRFGFWGYFEPMM